MPNASQWKGQVILLNNYKEPIVPLATSPPATEQALKCLGVISGVNPGGTALQQVVPPVVA